MTPAQKIAYEAVAKHGSIRKASRELGEAPSGVSRKYHAAKRYLETDEAITGAMTKVGMTDIAPLHSGWIKSDGASMYFQMPKGGDDKNTVLEAIRGAIDDLKDETFPEYELRAAPEGECLLVIDLADVHVGKLCVESETGYTYSRDVAVRRMVEGTRELIRKSSGMGIGRVLFVLGNDILHVDNSKATTTSGTPQDTHGTIHQLYRDAFAGYVKCIELARLTAPVDLIFCPSNHDWVMGWCLAREVGAWFRNAPDVTATEYNMSEIHRKYYRFGNNLIGLTHGDGAKEADLYPLMMTEAREHVSDCPHKYIYVHHFHHKVRKQAGVVSHKREKDHIGMTTMHNAIRSMEGDNVQIEYVRSPSPPDGWHHRKGYINRQAVECFVHHPYDGQDGRFTVWF